LGLAGVLRLPTVLPLLAVLFVTTVISRAFGLIVPLFVRELAAGSAALGRMSGLTVSLGAFAEAVSAMLVGWLSIRFKASRVLMLSLVGSVLLVLPMTIIVTPRAFLALRILSGLAAGGVITLCYAMGGAMFPDENRAFGYSVFSSAAMLGGAAGPVLSGVLSWSVGVRSNFAAIALLYGVLAFVVALGLRHRDAALPHPTESVPYMPLPR
ncbi:MAG TPA: MFS transporter, partial [Candidatus Polarisedimenticolaceae bacterium]|nr:MFS transporter [Candidatus Polarisedimenticolaceae bacterium]